jgi:hypothetical protein
MYVLVSKEACMGVWSFLPVQVVCVNCYMDWWMGFTIFG